MINLKSKSIGFTLIELIFVVAIIGVVITLGISYTSKLSERTKEKAAALQIQQILQAGMSYYVDYGKWPNVGNSGNKDDFYKHYISTSTTTTSLDINPWYSIQTSSEGYYYWEFTDTADQSKGMFKVTTAVPDKDIADRVISLLPNAYYDNPNIVAEVAIPGQALDVSRGYIIGANSFNIASKFAYVCLFTQSFGPDINNGIKICKSKNMHAVVMPQIEGIDVNLKSDTLYSVIFSILFKGACKISSDDYGIYYWIRGDYAYEAAAYVQFFRNTRVSYVVMCLPGSSNSADDHDLGYAESNPCQSGGDPTSCAL